MFPGDWLLSKYKTLNSSMAMSTGTALAGSLLAIVAPDKAAIQLAEILTQPIPTVSSPGIGNNCHSCV
jgi:hypothetical protein